MQNFISLESFHQLSTEVEKGLEIKIFSWE